MGRGKQLNEGGPPPPFDTWLEPCEMVLLSVHVHLELVTRIDVSHPIYSHRDTERQIFLQLFLLFSPFFFWSEFSCQISFLMFPTVSTGVKSFGNIGSLNRIFWSMGTYHVMKWIKSQGFILGEGMIMRGDHTHI